MSGWTRKRNITEISPGRWQRQYHHQPTHQYFSQTMDPITTEELQECTSQLPNGKSPGISKIPDEIWKKVPKALISILEELFNRCLKEANTPQAWKEEIIVLIPKKNQWEGNLTNTRPITLIETPRKILTKILTNRISKTCSEYDILKGDNFSVLKDTATTAPIHLVNFLTEHSNLNKKPL